MVRHIALSETLEQTVPLDITSAYNQVLRNVLMNKVNRWLPANTVSMVPAILSPTLITAAVNEN